MATFDKLNAAMFGVNVTYHINRVMVSSFARFIEWESERETYKKLSSLSDLQLKDIGLSRYEVSALYKGLF